MPEHTVTILLIDDDARFRQTFANEMSRTSNGIKYNVQCSDWTRCKTLFNHDIYVCDHKGSKCTESIELIKKIRNQDKSATIFAISSKGDYDLLRKVLELNLDGLIEKDPLDISPILDEAKTISETHKKVENMVKKLQKLSDLRKVI